MSPSDLANRFSNYTDAVVAFAVLNSVGFLTAMGDQDIRSELGEVSSTELVFGAFAAASFYTLLAIVLRRAELNLRNDAGEVNSDRVEKYQRYFQAARIAVIWFSASITILIYI